MMQRRNKSGKASNHNGRGFMAVLLAVLLAVVVMVGQPFASVRTYADDTGNGETYTEGTNPGNMDTGEDVVGTEPNTVQPAEELVPSEPGAEQPEEDVTPSDTVAGPDAEQPGETGEPSEAKRDGSRVVSEFKLSAQWLGLNDVAQDFVDNNNMHCSIGITIEGYENTYTQPITVKSQSDGAYFWSGYGYSSVYLNNKDDYIVFMANPALSLDDEAFSSLKITLRENSAGPESYSYENGIGAYTFNGSMYEFNPGKTEIVVNMTPAENQDVIMKNEILGFPSIIQKRLRGTNIPAGKVLAWRVERFTDGEWKPAAGVEYQLDSITMGIYLDYGYPTQGPPPLEPASGTTGEDGVIQITTNDVFYAGNIIQAQGPPSGQIQSLYVYSSIQVMFKDNVLVNAQSGQEGDLRVVEVEEESDEEWGHVDSFITSVWDGAYYYNWSYPGYTAQKDAGPDRAKGFLNSNRKVTFKVEKVVLDPDNPEEIDPDDDTEFTFTLEQFEDPDDESSLVPGANIPYTVYDKESGEAVEQGTTDENGNFTLKGGQYALFEVPEETKWQVTEQEQPEYSVDKIDICGEMIEDDPGNSAVLDLRTADPTTDPVRCQTLKGYAVPYLDRLMRMHGTQFSSGRVRSIYFGKTGDVDPSIITDKYVVMDELDTGSIKAYAVIDETGSYGDVYILSDDLMYTNPDCNSMFSGMWDLQKVSFSNVDFSLTKSMDKMFYYCEDLETLEGSSGWNTSSLTSARQMFAEDDSLKELDFSNMDTSKLVDMSGMFSRCYYLRSLNLSNWDVSNVKYMDSAFHYCYNMNSLDLTGWSPKSLETLDYAFYYCLRLPGLDLSNWDTSNVTSMAYTFALYNYWSFSDIDVFKELDLTGWDTSNVTNMEGMFYGAVHLESIYVGDKWNVSNVNSSRDMFYMCEALPNFDPNATDKVRAFVGSGGYLKTK